MTTQHLIKQKRNGPCGLILSTSLLLLLSTNLATGADTLQKTPSSGATDFTSTEYALFGSSASLRLTSSIDSEIGGASQPETFSGGSSTGRKFKSGFLSLLIPGAGQLYNGQKTKAFVFFGVEAAIWASYITFNVQGNNRTNTYEEYAGIFAGVQGSHNENYWQAVGRYMDSDDYNESIRREARALGEEPMGLVSAEDAWQWRNSGYKTNYQGLRADASSAYDRRDFMILFAIVNRAVSVYDAVRNSANDKLNVLGFDVKLDVTPSLTNPRAQCVMRRTF